MHHNIRKSQSNALHFEGSEMERGTGSNNTIQFGFIASEAVYTIFPWLMINLAQVEYLNLIQSIKKWGNAFNFDRVIPGYQSKDNYPCQIYFQVKLRMGVNVNAVRMVSEQRLKANFLQQSRPSSNHNGSVGLVYNEPILKDDYIGRQLERLKRQQMGLEFSSLGSLRQMRRLSSLISNFQIPQEPVISILGLRQAPIFPLLRQNQTSLQGVNLTAEIRHLIANSTLLINQLNNLPALSCSVLSPVGGGQVMQSQLNPNDSCASGLTTNYYTSEDSDQSYFLPNTNSTCLSCCSSCLYERNI